MQLFSFSPSDEHPTTSSQWRYDVFLSFRGKDTRKTFTDHLYNALVRAGIRTFRDDDEIDGGGDIEPECLRAIEESKFSIVILSKGYATSPWCLAELVHIMECRKTLGQVVWPIFYDVDPSHVEELKESFGEAIKAHEDNKNIDRSKLQKWKEALKEVAYLKGLDLPNRFDGHEAKNIDDIVKEISNKLSRTKLHVAIHPVDLKSRAHGVISLLNIKESKEVGVVGIYGMGGIGKTTVAKTVYNEVSDKFEGSCFLENVRGRFDPKGITQLQRQLLSGALARKHEKIDNVDRGLSLIRERLGWKKVLIVLDDVDKIEQIYKILGDCRWLRPGSRVIITTRIKDLVQASKFYRQYEIQELDVDPALELLSLHAFDKRVPGEAFMDCAQRFVKYAGGIPLALEVLGSSLRGEGIDVWNGRLNKLKVISHEDIHSKLEISYESLGDNEKSLFLDIACFFIGKKRDFVVSILDDLDLFPADGISSLIKRCLVKVDGYDNKLLMHDLIRDMGREIVRRKSPTYPGQRTRIWRQGDVIDVLTNETGTAAVEGLVVNLQDHEQNSFNSKAFKEMKWLRLLQLNYVCLTGNYKHISKILRWLSWHKFPLQSVPADLHLENLIALDLRYSSLIFFSEVKSLKKLKFLNLSHSHELTYTPNFEGFSSLEKLLLKDCTRLVEVHESIGHLTKLMLLNLQDCKNLESLPGSICDVGSLEKLVVSGCSKLEYLPEDLGNLTSLVTLLADGTALTTLPESIRNLKELKSLSLRECPRLFSPRKGSHTNIISFLPSSLKELDLQYCNILAIPPDLGSLVLLQILKLCGNNFSCLPAGVDRLPQLHTLWSNECKWLKSIPQLQSSLKSLHARNCSSLESINLTNFLGESDLQVNGCSSLKEIIGFFSLEPLEVDTIEKLLRITKGSLTPEEVANTNVRVIDNLTEACNTTPLQALSEKGAYSIFLPGSEIPRWFSHQCKGNILSFQVPSIAQRTRIIGLATCTVYAWAKPREDCFFNPDINIINKTKQFHWMYTPYVTCFASQVDEDMMWVCYWMFDNQMEGIDESDLSWRFKDEMEQGDQVEFSVDMGFGIITKKCGAQLLFQSGYHDSQSDDDALAIVASASSKHKRRFLRSIPKWLTLEPHQEITAHDYSERPLLNHRDDFLRWSKQRGEMVNATPDVYEFTRKSHKKPTSTTSSQLNFLNIISKQGPGGTSAIKLEQEAHVGNGTHQVVSSSGYPEENPMRVSPPSVVIPTDDQAKIPLRILAHRDTLSTTNISKSSISRPPLVSNLQQKSRNLLTELSSKLKISSESKTSTSTSSLALGSNFLQEQRKSLANFLNTSVEAVQEANAFDDIKRMARTLIPYTRDSHEKTALEDMIWRLEEFKDSVPSNMAMAEASQAQRVSLQARTKEVEDRLHGMQRQLGSLEAEFTELSEEEMEIENEIQRLVAKKEEVILHKNSVTMELEKANQGTTKDLEEWENLQAEIKETDNGWLQANLILAQANARWKLIKEKLAL